MKPNTDESARLDARLTAVLRRLPDAPMASNFTARLLDAVELEEKRVARSPGWNWRLLFPRLAVATAVLVFAGISLQRYEASSYRQEIARSVAMVAGSRSLPSVDALENLDAIQRLGQTAHADGELLAALQ